MLLGFGPAIIVLLVAVTSLIQISRVRESRAWVTHTIDVLELLHETRENLEEAERHGRVFAVAAVPIDAGRFAKAIEASRHAANTLVGITADNPDQYLPAIDLQKGIDAQLTELESEVSQAQAGQRAAGALEQAVRSPAQIEKLDNLMVSMTSRERGLLAARDATYDRALGVTAGIAFGGSFVAFLLAVAIQRWLHQSFSDREASWRAVGENRALLAKQTRELVVQERELANRVTELAAANASAQRALLQKSLAAAALERSNQALDQFAYVTSHDLKAPLRAIASLSEWIEEDLGPAVTATSREHLVLLRGRVHRMEALIDGILTYSRAGRSREATTEMDLDACLQEVVELLAPQPGVVSIVLEGQPRVTAAKVPFQQVWMNLIGNALKHAHAKDPKIELGAKDTGDAWECWVRDNGPGIEPRHHERIFKIFQTLASRDKVEGTGIGLSIVKKVIEAEGGRVWVESELGRGATFRFTWPKPVTTN